MKVINLFLIFTFLSLGNLFSQPKEFKLTDSDVNVGDSCVLEVLFHGYRLCGETIMFCDSIRLFLVKNNSISIEIDDYTDVRGSQDYNDTLTFKRAEAFKEGILYNSNIEPNRIISKGFGERVPLTVNKKIHKKYPFLPKGQILTNEFVKTLSSNEQREIAYKYNRRTVIKILNK